jgi:hypothetical protein
MGEERHRAAYTSWLKTTRQGGVQQGGEDKPEWPKVGSGAGLEGQAEKGHGGPHSLSM